jgi:hypothetical protein
MSTLEVEHAARFLTAVTDVARAEEWRNWAKQVADEVDLAVKE